MKSASTLHQIVKFLIAKICGDAVAIVVCCVVFFPVVILVLWQTMPHMVNGPDSVMWLVTGLFVLALLPFVFLLNWLSHRINE